MMQDSAALANSDYVQLEQLFQQLLKAKDSDAVADNCLATNSCSGVSCSAAIRDVTLTKRPSDPAAVAAVAAEKATSAAEAKRGDKLKPSSAPEKPSQPGGGLPAGTFLLTIADCLLCSNASGQPASLSRDTWLHLSWMCTQHCAMMPSYVLLRQSQ